MEYCSSTQLGSTVRICNEQMNILKDLLMVVNGALLNLKYVIFSTATNGCVLTIIIRGGQVSLDA